MAWDRCLGGRCGRWAGGPFGGCGGLSDLGADLGGMAFGEVGDLFEEEVDMDVEVVGSGAGLAMLMVWIGKHTPGSLSHPPLAIVNQETDKADLQFISVCAAPDRIFHKASSFAESQSTYTDLASASPSAAQHIRQGPLPAGDRQSRRGEWARG